ncbi:GNAT family N-acetyltransferase [Sphingomonas oligophenolica]|uniref:N-acetyltransferase n=1 Tax=Sphingomonas oligophenolica TaxID=301154 RepID=A0A502CNX0_9SPHN|nr:GNAT family N-acetyltransferase [Sphingomonas oligophenolica]TPG15345.1 N-acetyltransferase [Sphingomonas oligophenolica]
MDIAPTLVTARLTLRAHHIDDLDACAALWGEPAVYRYIGGKPPSREEVWHRVLRYIGHWSAIGYGYWLAQESATGRLVGELGVIDTRRDTVPSFAGTPEVGWALSGWAHCQGFAREALDAVLGWIDSRGIARTMCIIDPANAPSIGLAERVGYRFLTEGVYRDAPTRLYERIAVR